MPIQILPPTDVSPKQYELHIEPDLQYQEGHENTFQGSVVIHASVLKPTKNITLNAKALTITSAAVQWKGTTLLVPQRSIKCDSRADHETAILHLGKLIPKGEATISLTFHGKLGSIGGLYKSKYTGKDGSQKYMATTQFEAADARQAFPCIDHPAAKATFDISVTCDDCLDVVSNTEVKEVKQDSASAVSGKTGKKTVSFARTPVMSTYLVYIGVGEFEWIEDSKGKTVIRVVTTPGKSSHARFALQAARQCLGYYETYFGIPFPLSKLDLIAVPDFGFGAMENWGAITYREDALLLDPATASLADKQRVAITIAHELVHQWFGNLVTMKWWNDLWLNESFADWMSYKAVEAHYPELDPWASFLSRSASEAFDLDALHTSHPINVDVRTPRDVDEVFDAISYSKGGMVLRMLEAYLDENAFRQGLRNYLTLYKYGNAAGDDLWRALEKESGKPILAIARSWINQIGFPVVEVKADGPKLFLRQRRFLYSPDKKKERSTKAKMSKGIWDIPLVYTVDGSSQRLIMDSASATAVLPRPSASNALLKANSNQVGFYRVHYSPELLNNLGQAVKQKRLGAVDRWGLSNDLFALCLAGEISLQDYFHFIGAYQNEDSYIALTDIIGSLHTIELLSTNTTFAEKIKQELRTMYSTLLQRIGEDSRQNDKDTDKEIRAGLIRQLGRLGDKHLLEKANKLFKNPGQLEPNMKVTVYSLAAWQGGSETYKKLVDMHNAATDPQDIRKILIGLAGFQDQKLLQQALEFVASGKVRQQNRVTFYWSMLANPAAKSNLWPWIKANWKTFRKQYSEGAYARHFGRLLGSLDVLADTNVSKDIQALLKKEPIPGTTRDLAQLMEKMKISERFVERMGKEFRI
ncbi:M1 family metallopeptidase [Candidatus Woesearchaeota archaeon]|nr:M1 family metallopeptidase [Candidatus Woesearchaeota archaeon]